MKVSSFQKQSSLAFFFFQSFSWKKLEFPRNYQIYGRLEINMDIKRTGLTPTTQKMGECEFLVY